VSELILTIIHLLNIIQIESVKFLGVVVDEHINWKAHIRPIGLPTSKKLPKILGLLSKLQK